MSLMLNFSEEEAEGIRKKLDGFQKILVKSKYEAERWAIHDSVVTLYLSGKIVVQGRDESKVKELLLETLKGNGALTLGFDETGRGEHSGPMVLGFVLGGNERLRELRDSKKTAGIEKAFESVSKNALAHGSINLNPEWIDRLRVKGFTLDEIEAEAINKLGEFFGKFEPEAEKIADGNRLKNSSTGIKFVVKADDKVPVVGGASVQASFSRKNSSNREEKKSFRKKA